MASQLPAACSVVRGDFESLPAKVQDYVTDQVELCQPDNVYICDGSKEENESLINQLIESGVLTKLTKYDNWYVELVSPCFIYYNFDILCQKFLLMLRDYLSPLLGLFVNLCLLSQSNIQIIRGRVGNSRESFIASKEENFNLVMY